ncbi:MAG: hypothetical protein QOI22_1201, partial [Verrucomicrobiota bacterium]
MAKSFASITLAALVGSACVGIAANAAIPKNLVEAHGSLAKHFSAADMERIRELKSEDEMIRLV